VLKIEPEGWYLEHQLRIMGLDGEGLEKARDKKQLRYKVVGEEVWYKGAWLIEWLEKTPEVAHK
jgi:hypothetical protein